MKHVKRISQIRPAKAEDVGTLLYGVAQVITALVALGSLLVDALTKDQA